MLFSQPFSGAFGLDIGDLSIKLIQLAPRHRLNGQTIFTVKEMRRVALSPGCIVNGELQQPEAVRKKILHILGKEGGAFRPINSPWVVADLPEPKTFIKMINVDLPCSEIMEEDVVFQLKKHLPFNIEETYFDWQKVEPNCNIEKTTKVLVGAALKTIADSYTYLLESAGLTPLALEIEAISIIRAMITANKIYTGEARAILDLGATRSSLMIFDNDSIQFSTGIDFSGELITTAIMQELKVDYHRAEELKTKNGLNYDEKNPKYLKVTMALVDKMIDDVKKALAFYKERFDNSNPVTHITMCGGVSCYDKLDSAIARKLKISARLGNPWKNLNDPKFVPPDDKQSAIITSALGLALRAADLPMQE